MKKPDPDFNWPPPDEELEQGFMTLQKDGLEAPESPAESAASLSNAVVESEPVVASETVVESQPVAASEAVVEAEAVAEGEIALDSPTSDITAEIAHLQALIEELTQKVEWRIN